MKESVALISLDLFLLLMIFFLIIYIRLPKILSHLNRRLNLCRRFIADHEAPFNIGFILLFTLEQGLLVIYVFLFRDNLDHLEIIINLFALMVIATASLQAIILQTRLKYEKERHNFARKTVSFLQKAFDLDKKERKS